MWSRNVRYAMQDTASNPPRIADVTDLINYFSTKSSIDRLEFFSFIPFIRMKLGSEDSQLAKKALAIMVPRTRFNSGDIKNFKRMMISELKLYILTELYATKKVKPRTYSEMILIGLHHKEFVKATMHMFNTVHDVLDFTVMANDIIHLTHEDPNIDSIFLYNVITYLIPAVHAARERAGVLELLNVIEKSDVSDVVNLIHMKLSSTIYSSIPYQQYECNKLKLMHFIVVTRRKEKKKRYSEEDIQFVLGCLRDLPYKEIETYHDFVSNVYAQCNLALKKGEDVSVFLNLINVVHDMALQFLTKVNLDSVDKGLWIYSKTYQVIYKLKPKRSVAGTAGVNNLSFKDLLLSTNYENFGSRADVLKLVHNMRKENAEAILSIFQLLDDITEILEFHHIDYIFNTIIHKADAFIENVVAKYMDLLCKYYSDVAQYDITPRALRCMTKSLDQNTVKINCHMVSCLHVILHYNKLGGGLPHTIAEDVESLIILIIEEFKVLENHGDADIKLAEKSLAAAFDLYLRVSSPSEEVMSLIQDGLQCNMRSTVAQIQVHLTKFISASFEEHREFYMSYFTEALQQLINSAVSSSARLRRAVEHRVILLALCNGASGPSKAKLVKEAIRKMTNMQNVKSDNACIILHCLDEMMTDASLKACTDLLLEDCVLFCLFISTKYSYFRVKNATNLLFNNLVKRIFPSNDSYKNGCLHDFLLMRPRLHSLLNAFHGRTNNYERESKLLFSSLLAKSHNENVIAFSQETLGLEAIPPKSEFLSSTYDAVTRSKLILYVKLMPKPTYFENIAEFKLMVSTNIELLDDNNIYYLLFAMAQLTYDRHLYLTNKSVYSSFNMEEYFERNVLYVNSTYDLTRLEDLGLIEVIARSNGLLSLGNSREA